ncbi:NAD(P)-binding domain-containing protein [Flagellimonas lutimaris]|uniref:NAD(P)-binding domain-containing protein n=1 Tax=Flagellimonas lutimaris TaxID=475082 RepID=UPI003F5CDAE7
MIALNNDINDAQLQKLPIAIIGGGPVGLAAAAQLKNSGQNFVLFESAKEVGANILSWGHVNLFSPWEYNIDKVAEKLLRAAMVEIPNKELVPNGNEIVHQYLKPLAELDGIKENIHFNSTVLAIGRTGLDKTKTLGREKLPFSIQVTENGQFKSYSARAVIDASGTWHNPNPVGSGGIFAIGELENRKYIHYGMPDIKGKALETFANKSILVVGGGHSAIGSILALNGIAKEFPNTKIHWVLRKERVEDVYGGQEADEFKSRGALGIAIEKLVNNGIVEVHTPVHINEIRKTINGLLIRGTKQDNLFLLGGIDEIISCTGTRPDFGFLREVRFEADSFLECVPALTELIDPNIHSCGTVRPHGEAELRQVEKDFYIVGMKSYGRAPTFLMATGYEQVRSIVAHINGDHESAKNVELHLPETGVCNSGLIETVNKETNCDTSCGA